MHFNTTPCLKNVPPMACYNFDTYEQILLFLAEMLRIKQAIKKCFDMPPQMTCASALAGKRGKHENHIFHSNAVLVESAAVVGLCCTQCAVFLKEKLSSVMCLIASTFVEIVRYPINAVYRLSLRLDEEQLPSFTQRSTP